MCSIIWRTFSVIVICLQIDSVRTEQVTNVTKRVCDIFLAPSLAGFGRGIIAGRSFSDDEVIDYGTTVLLTRSKYENNWSLWNYVWRAAPVDEDLHDILVLGAGSMFNHRVNLNVGNYFQVVPNIPEKGMPSNAFTTYTPFVTYATKKIYLGEELFVSYGDSWLSDRGYNETDPDTDFLRYPKRQLEKVGVCLSDVIVEKSSLPKAGKGLFAKYGFKKGEIVIVSPGGTLPRHEVEAAASDSLLLNYCVFADNVDMVVCPFGNFAMVNHGGVNHNVEMEWYAWADKADDLSRALNGSVDELLSARDVRLDLAFRATRDIKPGEEVTAFYGTSWEAAWKSYLDRLEVWVKNDGVSRYPRPQFRHSVQAPPGLFPDHWKSSCAGESCNISSYMAVIDSGNETEAVILAKQYIANGYPKQLKTNESIQKTSTDCDLYLAPSKHPFLGRGLIAGRNFSVDDTVVVNPVFNIQKNYILSNWSLWNYVWSHVGESMYDLSACGPGALSNHREDYHISHTSQRVPTHTIDDQPKEGYATDPAFQYYIIKDAEAGEELFSYYGSDWLGNRNITYNDTEMQNIGKYSIEDLKDVGFCETDLVMNKSVLPKAGKGLFARRAFAKGEVVSVMPVSLLPRHEVEWASYDSVLVNMCIVCDDSDVVLHPFGQALLINHGGVDSNVEMEWFSWKNKNYTESLLQMSPQTLATLPYAPLDIGYRATRDIEAGEELTLYYGAAWEEAWKAYLGRLEVWTKGVTEDLGAKLTWNMHKPLFRHGIQAAPGMCPDHWKRTCIGQTCEKLSATFEEEKKEVSLARKYVSDGFHSPLIGNVSAIIGNTSAAEGECAMYLAPSKVEGLAFGVIAGSKISANEVVSSIPSIQVRRGKLYNTMLQSLVFDEKDPNHISLAVGIGNFFNHHLDKSLKFDMKTGIPHSPEAFASHHTVSYFTNDSLELGEEIFASYSETYEGPNAANLKYPNRSHIAKYTASELATLGHCLTDVTVYKSLFPKAGNGLFARKAFKKGDLVTLTLVMFLPKHVVADANLDDVLLNFCFVSQNSDVAVFPMSVEGMINHGGLSSNLRVEWSGWRWGVAELSNTLKLTPLELTSASSSRVDVGYRATRDIEAGEELTLYYGAAWEEAWKAYLGRLEEWYQSESSDMTASSLTKPLFRHGIELPEGMFPDHWMTECAGTGCKLPNEMEEIDLAKLYVSDGYPEHLSLPEKPIEDTKKSPEDTDVCDLYLAPSKAASLGRGIIAGRKYNAEEAMQATAGIVVKGKRRSTWSLRNYTWKSNAVADFSFLAFGVWSLYNSRSGSGLQQCGFRSTADESYSGRDWVAKGTVYEEAYNYFANVDISAGEELFTDYGSSWYESHGVVYDESMMMNIPNYDIDTLKTVGHCMTDIFYQPSLLPDAGYGVFAKKAFRKGDIVSVSPVLFLPRGEAEADSGHDTLLNYCFVSEGSDMAIVPLHISAMANHAGAESANMAIEWFGWGKDELLQERLQLSASELVAFPYAPLDIGYRATRDIEAGEELTLYYGAAWEEAWKTYLDHFLEWVDYRSESARILVDDAPHFRQSISAPFGFFPDHWKA